ATGPLAVPDQGEQQAGAEQQERGEPRGGGALTVEVDDAGKAEEIVVAKAEFGHGGEGVHGHEDGNDAEQDGQCAGRCNRERLDAGPHRRTTRQIMALRSAAMYSAPSGPTATPDARNPVGPDSWVANVSYSPVGVPPWKGMKTTRYPACGSGARFHEPCQARNAPPRNRGPKASPG